MRGLTLKNLRAHKMRLALTTFAVMLAVSFVVSAYVLGDGLRSSFEDVSADVTAGVDLEVRNVADFGDAQPLAADTVSAVAAVDGVAEAFAVIEAADNAVRPITATGESISTNGPPQLAFNWIDNAELSPFTIVDGAPPQVGEFTIDVDSAAEHGFTIGDTYQLMVPGGEVTLTLSGTSSFGADNSTLGAVLMQMNTDQASELFGIDGINSVAVQVADSSATADVQASVAAAVPTAEVVDHATVLEETTTGFTDEIDLVGNILLGFGFIALFVSIFIIYNTFAIVLGQRTRELALLRIVGADPKQLRRSVLGEALVMGIVASAGGIAGGVAVAKGIDALFGLMGFDLVDYPLIIARRTLVAAAIVGVGVTMLAASGPARRAVKVPPIVALTGATATGTPGSRGRTIAGLGLLSFGLLAGVSSLNGVNSTSLMIAGSAVGAAAIFVGVTLVSPMAVRTVTAVVGLPMRGVTGRLAKRNAARNSRRTATTAAALMIGLTLVSTALVVGDSVKATIGSAFEASAKADYYVTDELDEVQFPDTLAGELRESEVVAAATGFTPFEARIGGTVTDAVGLDFDQMGAVLDVDVTPGGFDSKVDNAVVVSVDEATAIGASVGEPITIESSNGASVEATIVGLFEDQTVMAEDYLVDNRVLSNVGIPQTPKWLAISIASGSSASDVEAFVADLSNEYDQASVETAAQFRERVEEMVDKILTMVNAMVMLAVIIALIGIANTLALSVFERTRELGLLRAVGMSRRQLRRMVRLEAALVATFGATLGVGLGLLFGLGAVSALPESLASELSIPISQIGVVVLVAAMAGVFAAWLPARRAGRLDVLHAIAQ
jgi:putative ABC transport system permease protein